MFLSNFKFNSKTIKKWCVADPDCLKLQVTIDIKDINVDSGDTNDKFLEKLLHQTSKPGSFFWGIV